MSTLQQPRGGAARGRGRGSAGGGGRGGTPTAARTTYAAIAAKSKIGPTRELEPDWVNESGLLGDTFVVWVGCGKTAPVQVTFHRPIGHTGLSDRAWVATPTAEVGLLLERKSSEELSRWERERSTAIRADTLASGIGRKLVKVGQDSIEAWSFSGAPHCGPTVKAAMASAKAAGKAEAEWIHFVSDDIKAAEADFKKDLKDEKRLKAYEAAHPKPTYETRGGPLGDRPQKAVDYLHGLSLAAARDKVTAVMFGSFPIQVGEAAQGPSVANATGEVP